MISRRRAIALAAATAFPTASARRTFAQTSIAPAPSAPDWPNRFVRLIVPFPPGGGTDAIALRSNPERGEPLSVSVTELRPDRGSRAGIADLRVPQYHGGADRLARPHGRRFHRLCQGQQR